MGRVVGVTMKNTRTDITIPFPDVGERRLRITVGACRLTITRGDGPTWVTGTYDDPTGSLPCRITQEGGAVQITQDPHLTQGLGRAPGVPTFDLALGTAQPYMLTIETGASDTAFELGGLPLTRLIVKLGAGKNALRFSTPNPRAMSVFDLDAGAGSMEIYGLANANFADMTLDGGAATFTCDFGGTLQRDAYARISTGLSAVDLSVPRVTAARIISEAVLGQLDVSSGFTTREGGYWTAAALAGGTPVLTIHANVALGSLRLRAT
jgi:hypothetical protein